MTLAAELTDAARTQSRDLLWRRIAVVREISENVRASVDWLSIYSDAIGNSANGMFPREINAWHAANRTEEGETSSQDSEREFVRGRQISTSLFSQLKL